MRYSISVTKRQRERIPLLLRSLGINHLQEPIRRPNGFPLWQIFYGVSGSGEFFLDGERAVLRPGQIAVLEPHMKHGYQSSGGDWTVHYVGFEGDACIRILSPTLARWSNWHLSPNRSTSCAPKNCTACSWICPAASAVCR